MSLTLDSEVPIVVSKVANPLALWPPPFKEWVILPGFWALRQILHWSVSAKLPFVFLLLDPSKRREARSTALSRDLRHVGPENHV